MVARPTSQAVTAVVAEFDRRTSTGAHGEVSLFRSLVDSLHAAAPHVVVEEYHGGRHQVWHTTDPVVGIGTARCELADLMVVVFHQRRNLGPRLSFLQAKYERRRHPLRQAPHASYVQWSLLARRPPIQGFGDFAPPPDLLSGSVLPSVGTFGFFTQIARRQARYDLVYASADILGPVHQAPALRKYGRLQGFPGTCCPLAPCCRHPLPVLRRGQGVLQETTLASTLDQYLAELFALRIGTPVTAPGWQAVSWLLQQLRSLRGAVARELAGRIEDWVRDQPGFFDAGNAGGVPGRGSDDDPAPVPARSLVLVRSSLDPLEELPE